MKVSRETSIPARHLKSSVSYAVASGVYSALSCGSYGSKAAALLEKGAYRDLVSLEVDPTIYSDCSEFADDYLACEFMSKYPEWDTGVDRKQVAVDKFLLAEQACAEANKRLAPPDAVRPVTSTSAACWSHMRAARRKIRKLLGPFSWDKAAVHFAWGPGASTQVRSREGDAYFKYGVQRPQVTAQCAMLAGVAIALSPRWYNLLAGIDPEAPSCIPSPEFIVREHLEIIEGNRVVTVPKNAKTDRVIAIEPHMNMYVQKGIGALIRHRLLKVGVNLNDQTLNQRLAREASISGMLATVDLSAASDSVSMGLCEALLPEDWLLAIKLSRSPIGVLPDGSKVSYNKVSSMGNGFTFELESLIFWALVSSVVESDPVPSDRRIGVYGDDLIFSVSSYAQVQELLSYCGFTVNAKKSFCIGYFRESCGKHYFNGVDVSPFYIRKDVNTEARLLVVVNNLRRYARQGLSWGMDGRFRSVYESLVRILPRERRTPSIPDGYGDGALIGDFDECRPSKAGNGLDGWIGKCFIPIPRRRRVHGGALLLKALGRRHDALVWWRDYLPPSALNAVMDRVVSKSEVDTLLSEGTRQRAVKLLCPQWQSFGPWI